MKDKRIKYSKYLLVFVLIFVLWFVAKLIGCGSPLSPIASNAPVIVSVVPANNAAGVALDAKTTATFNMSIDPASISTESFMLQSPAGTVSGSISYDAASLTATFTPSAGLAYSTTYTASVSASVREPGGRPMDGAYTWNFSTVFPSGNLDPAFTDGTDSGFVVNRGVAGADSSDPVSSIAVDSDGKIVAVGAAMTGIYPGTQYMFILKYNDNGSLDTAFSSDGKLAVTATAGTGFDDRGMAVTTDPLNNILVAGTSADPNSSPQTGSMVVWRYKKNGSLDTGLAGTGKVIQTLADYYIIYPYAIAIDAAGKIVVAGNATSRSRGDGDIFVARYNSDGTLDPSFTGGVNQGFSFFNGAIEPNGNEYGYSIAFDQAGNILVAGMAQNSTFIPSMAVFKFTASGALDPNFGDGTHQGYAVYNGAIKTGSGDFGRSIGLDPAGKIWVAGYGIGDYGTMHETRGVAIWKLNPDGRKDSTITYTAATAEANSMVVDPSGKILVAGRIRAGTTSDIGIWRYEATGSLDTNFGIGGVIAFDLVSGSGMTRGSNADIGNAITIDHSGRILVGGQTGGALEGYSSIILRYK